MEPSTVTAPLPAAIHLKRILVPIDFSAPSQQALKYALRFALANGIAALVKTGRVEGWSLAAEPAIHRRIVDLPMASTLSAHCSSKNRWMREKEEGDDSGNSSGRGG